MKRFRKQLAVALITAVMASSFSFNGIAADNKGKWELNNEGEWNYKQNDEILTDKIIPHNSERYYVKEDGAMAHDEFFQYDGKTWYASLAGQLEWGWVYLSDDGKRLPDFQDGSWYYFSEKEGRFEDNGWSWRIDEHRFSFDEDGRMRSRSFVEDGKKYYYEYDGQRADNKWLNIEGDWYRFKSDGSCWTADDTVATGSEASEYQFNEDGTLSSGKAPCRTIESIEVKGDEERSIPIGEPLEITFNVTLATDSDAEKQKLTEDHDFWIEEEESLETYKRGWKKSIVNGKDEYTISYVPELVETFKVRLVIDGVESDWVTLTSEVGENESDIIKGIEHTLSGSASVSNRVESIKALYEGLEDNSRVKKTWINKIGELKDIDDSFVMFNRNMISTDDTEVKSLLGTGDLELIGGSLNASQGEEIRLSAEKGAAVVLPETFERQTSIELNLYKDNVDTSDLDIPVIVSMPVPRGMSTEGLKVFHIMADGSSELLNIKTDGNKVSFVTDGFSNFVFAGKAVSNSNNSGSSGGGSDSGASGGFISGKKSSSANSIPETAGQWQHTETGWQFKKPDGSLYQNTWIYAKGKWYWIESTGIMAQGWKELNGEKYYLLPAMGEMVIGWILDGQNWFYTDANGVMLTGWVNAGGKWYYLEADGHMLSSTTTPDGYPVDANGVWIQ